MTPNLDKAAPDGLLLSDDLIFISRVTAEACALGLTVLSVRTVASLVERAGQHQPRGIIVDLAFPGLDLNAMLSALKEIGTALPRVIAYGPHVEAEALRAARAAGCDPVLPRSKFVEALPRELGRWLS
jgi:CheY-like chemotaxis protein